MSPIQIPRGEFKGWRASDSAVSDADHFIKCGACGCWIDCRDLGAVLDHEGPLPHPASDQAQ